MSGVNTCGSEMAARSGAQPLAHQHHRGIKRRTRRICSCHNRPSPQRESLESGRPAWPRAKDPFLRSCAQGSEHPAPGSPWVQPVGLRASLSSGGTQGQRLCHRSQWDPCHGSEPALKTVASHEHGGTRTPDPQNRNLMLYPTELHAH